jgi:6-hydroxycyclohex-1-ene-1-carbonyl-CoA dehydrogenase
MEIVGWEMHAVGQPLRPSRRTLAGPGPGQALVQVAGCGVCHTDLGFLEGSAPVRHPLPLVLGHEIAGRVVAEGEGVRGLLGRDVIVPAVIPCGNCDACARGRGDICRKQVFPGNDDHGGFATHVAVPAGGLCPVPQGLSREELARLSVVADAVSTAYAAVKKSGLRSGELALVVGAGGVGGFTVQICAALGARVIAIDVDPARLARLEPFGAHWTVDARQHPGKALREAVRGLVKEHRLPQAEWRIFETSGSAAGQEAAFGLLTFGATLGVVGFHAGEVKLRLSNLMAFAARAEGTWGCAPALFPEVLDLVLSRRVAVDPFVEMHPLSEINAVFVRLREHQIAKRPVLLPGPGDTP